MKNGMTTKEVASKLQITGKELRRILRSFDRFADGKYTRYSLTSKDVEQVAKRLRGNEPVKVKKVKKAKAPIAPPVEPVTEQVNA